MNSSYLFRRRDGLFRDIGVWLGWKSPPTGSDELKLVLLVWGLQGQSIALSRIAEDVIIQPVYDGFLRPEYSHLGVCEKGEAPLQIRSIFHMRRFSCDWKLRGPNFWSF